MLILLLLVVKLIGHHNDGASLKRAFHVQMASMVLTQRLHSKRK